MTHTGITRVFVVLFSIFNIAAVAGSSSLEVIDAPDSVGIGQPFLVRLAFPFVADDVEVIWNTKPSHPSIEAGGELTRATGLLGTPLTSDPARLELLVNVLTDERTESYSKEIEVVDHHYESETLFGATGRATGAHLHLSVFAQGVNIDPAPLFSME